MSECRGSLLELPAWALRGLLSLQAACFPQDPVAASEQAWRRTLEAGLGDQDFERILLLYLDSGRTLAYSSLHFPEEPSGAGPECGGPERPLPADPVAAPVVLGMAYMQRLFEDVELLTLAVAKRARRQGIGRALLSWSAAYWRGQGARRMLLEVDAANRPALALYQNLGFRSYGRRRHYYGRGQHADLLEKDLTVLTC